jgi:hypothetical protein
VVLLESVDGRIHLAEAKEAFKGGKPVFIDKPVAGTLPEAIAVYELARKNKVSCFSSSSSRFGADLRAEIFRAIQAAGCRAVGDVGSGLGSLDWAGFRALLDLRRRAILRAVDLRCFDWCRAGGGALDLRSGSLAWALDLVQLGACLRAA